MSTCRRLGIIGRIADRSTPAIVKGSDAFLVTQLVFKGENDPAEIVGFSGATGFFPQADSTEPLPVSGTLESADLAEIRFELAASGTALLADGEEQSFEISVEDSFGLVFYQFDGKLVVKERLF